MSMPSRPRFSRITIGLVLMVFLLAAIAATSLVPDEWHNAVAAGLLVIGAVVLIALVARRRSRE
jgi:hypothetical protein